MASAQQKPKKSKGEKNPDRKNGKAWKQGKSPDVRAAELAAKRRTRTP